MPRGHLLLSIVTKVSKNTLVPVVRKYSKSQCQFGSNFSSLQFLLTLDIGNKSLLIGDFEVSALCFSSALNRTSLFKTASLKCVRWSFRFNKSVLVCPPLRGAVLFKVFLPDIR